MKLPRELRELGRTARAALRSISDLIGDSLAREPAGAPSAEVSDAGAREIVEIRDKTHGRGSMGGWQGRSGQVEEFAALLVPEGSELRTQHLDG